MTTVERGFEQVGREYRLDAGDTFAYAVTVRAEQRYALEADGQAVVLPVTIALSIRDHEAASEPQQVHLAPSDVNRLVAMLQRALMDLT